MVGQSDDSDPNDSDPNDSDPNDSDPNDSDPNDSDPIRSPSTDYWEWPLQPVRPRFGAHYLE